MPLMHNDAASSTLEELREIVKQQQFEIERLNREFGDYRDAYDHSPVMMVAIRSEYLVIDDCNLTLVEKLGYSCKSDILGKVLAELYHPSCQDKYLSALALYKKTGKVVNFELALRTFIGDPLPVLLNVEAVKDAEGGTVRNRCYWTDISELKNTQAMTKRLEHERDAVERSLIQSRKEINQSQLFFRVMSELNTDGWWDWDLSNPQSDQYFISDNLKVLLDYQPHEIPNSLEWLYNTIHPEDRESVKAAVEEHLTLDKPFNVQLRLKCKNNHYKWFISRGYAIKNEAGKVYRMLGSYTDISPLKISEESLRIKNFELMQFSYRISHDLKSPLSGIKGLCDCVLLDLSDKDYDNAGHDVERIRERANTLSALVNDILELSHADLAEEGSIEVDVAQLIGKLSASFEELSAMSQVKVTFSNDITSCQLYSQPTRLYQVIYNLVSNGMKYRNKDLNDESYVHVKFSDTAQQCQLDIVDNGIGVPEQYQSKMFERFQRFHPDAAQGSGLGLAIVKSNLDRMGANISFKSSDEGTHFTIRFPSNRV